VAKKTYSPCLIFLGAGSEEAALRAQAQKLGVADQVFFEGWQNPIVYYQVADLLLHTSQYEGYGLVLVEARRMGLPVLSTDVGVAKEVGARISSLQGMAAALEDEIQKGRRREEPLSLQYHTMKEYSAAIRQQWKEEVNAKRNIP
jgi:glycosyltransferase involved in cell wall biosynthesis